MRTTKEENEELLNFVIDLVTNDDELSRAFKTSTSGIAFCIDAMTAYQEQHRIYHGVNHVKRMLGSAAKKKWLTPKMVLTILAHDVVFDPKCPDPGGNERNSVEMLSKYVVLQDVNAAILETIDHRPQTELGKMLCELDLENLYGPIEDFVKYENEVFKEFQFMDWNDYLRAKVPFLEQMNVPATHINYLKYRRPNIAVYPGSFNMFHRGHLNILEKAERIFDKVIIARGHNPAKEEQHTYPTPDVLRYHQIEEYDGLLTDFIGGLGYDVTVIRGLRNFTDMQYELNQYRFLQELMPDIKLVSIFCDKEFEHISSSTLKMLEKYGKDERYVL